MTDKEIIIDGVDVSGCEELANYENVLFVCHKTGNKCEINNDCHYKQLKRLEQENKNLREAMHKDFCSNYVLGECGNEHHNNCVGRNQCIKDLEQENARLKEDLEYACTNCANLIAKDDAIDKYRQCLQEIKDIAERRSKEGLTLNYYKGLQQILQKISECEVE